jgi:hypothetical protein
MTKPLTPAEAAAALRKSKRWLLEWLRKHPADKLGEPYFTPVGRDKIFHQSDIARIEAALRGGIQCRSNSDRRAPARRRTMKSAEHTSESTWNAVADLLNDPSLKRSSKRSSDALRTTDNTQRPSLRLVPGSQHS